MGEVFGNKGNFENEESPHYLSFLLPYITEGVSELIITSLINNKT